MSDHYGVIGQIPDVEIEQTAGHSRNGKGHPKNIKGEKASKFLLEQQSMKLDRNNLNYTEQTSICIPQ